MRAADVPRSGDEQRSARALGASADATRAGSAPRVDVRPAFVRRWSGEQSQDYDDWVAIEEPLSIRVDGVEFATTMRTPGADHDLAVGLLRSEGVIQSRDDLVRVVRMPPLAGERPQTLDVLTLAGSRAKAGWLVDGDTAQGPSRRGTLTTAACGVCARNGIDDLLEHARPVEGTALWGRSVVLALPRLLHSAQPCFALTGGLHAAAIVDSRGQLGCVREDVGRHNAVDKVLGFWLLARRGSARDHALVVSGRASFELVQKASVLGVSLLASVSAPSSAAVALAAQLNLTLVGFVRGARFNVYAHGGRIHGR